MEEDLDLREIVASLWVRRWWLVACVILSTSVFAAAAFLMAPIYRASTVLISASADRSGLNSSLNSALSSLGGLAGISVGSGDSETEEALAVLRSRQFTESFIQDKKLMPVLFFGNWDAQTSRWKADSKPPTPAQAYKYFDTTIRSIAQDNNTGLVTLHIEWRDREQAAEWANELVERLNVEMRDRAIEKAAASVGYLENELNGTSLIGAREAINRLIEEQIKQRMLANVTHEYAFRVVDKAMPPDIDDPVRPRKLMLLLAGPFVGVVAGVFFVGFLSWVGRAKREV